jgi:hypothetical protein
VWLTIHINTPSQQHCAAACVLCACRLGYEVEATTVSLAFGVHESQPSQKEVFAFLPVRRYGLNFIVQGDFVVPSSRGDVDLDDPFNQLLHSKVSCLHVKLSL